MKIISNITNMNSKLPISFCLSDIGGLNNTKNKNESTFFFFFELLKKHNFYLDKQNSYSPNSNYSNYELGKIEISDFIKIDKTRFFSIINSDLTNWSKVYDCISTSELDWFINLTQTQILSFTERYSQVYIFKLPANLEHNKRHKYFSLYEFFLSFIIFEESISESFCYGELFYK